MASIFFSVKGEASHFLRGMEQKREFGGEAEAWSHYLGELERQPFLDVG